MNEETMESVKTGIITIDHLNFGILILGLIAFFAVCYLFYSHSRELLSHISGSLKDPVTGKWSPKLSTALAISSMIVLCHIVWLKYAFVQNNFSLLMNIMTLDYGYLTVAYSLKTVEKMQAKKIDGKEDPMKTTTLTASSTVIEPTQ